MNLSEFIDEDNETFALFDVNETEQQKKRNRSTVDFTTVETFSKVVQYVCIALGIPGNILSAIVWLRLHVASKNSSAVYLVVLAINDLVFLLDKSIYHIVGPVGWLYGCSEFVHTFTTTFEPLLVLAFSLERLIAICYPFQVGSVRCIHLYNHHCSAYFVDLQTRHESEK